MSISDLLHSDPAMSLVAGAIGAVWTFFRSRDWYAKARNRRYYKAVRALEAGVEQTYRTYVREIKHARDDGKLTESEIERARQMARRTAIEYGRTTGIDVLAELGAEYIDLWISKLVRRAKLK